LASSATGQTTTITFISVGSVPRGNVAKATIQTQPDAACSIVYMLPSGRASTAKGLDPQVADYSGRITWAWLISGSTGRGDGSVIVTCNGVRATHTITIT
jgi:hypothetical protein